MYRKFTKALEGSHKDDLILPTGLSIMGSIACSIFAVKHGRINLLIYYTRNGRGIGTYKERTIMLEDLNGENVKGGIDGCLSEQNLSS